MSKEHWDNNFLDHDYVYGKIENVFIHDMSGIIPDYAKVGCSAEGEGRNAVYLVKQDHDVTSYDQSTVGLENVD